MKKTVKQEQQEDEDDDECSIVGDNSTLVDVKDEKDEKPPKGGSGLVADYDSSGSE